MKTSIILCTLIAASALFAVAGETKNASAAEGAKKTSLEGKAVATADNYLLKNGSLNEPAAKIASWMRNMNIENNVLPSSWGFMHLKGKEKPLIAWRKFPESDNHYVHVKNSAMLNDLHAKADNYRVNFRYRGKAHLTFYILRRKKNGGSLPSKIVHILEVDTDKWTDGKFDFPKVGEDEEKQTFGIWVQNGGVDFDEVYLAPVSK